MVNVQIRSGREAKKVEVEELKKSSDMVDAYRKGGSHANQCLAAAGQLRRCACCHLLAL